MASKRILLVDDSSLYQRLLSEVINEREGLEVVGVASNGKMALDMMQQLKPDLVTLDVLMPEMDGIQTLIELNRKWPSVATLVISSLTAENSESARDAMSLGASACAVKPGSRGGISDIRDQMIREILPKIESLCGLTNHPGALPAKSPQTTALKMSPQASVLEPMNQVSALKPVNQESVSKPINQTPVLKQVSAASESSLSSERFGLVAIGVSTGGPDALVKVLSQLPGNMGLPIVVVQHMPAKFTTKLAQRLDLASPLDVVEAQQGEKLQINTVYIAPGDYHMVLDQRGADVVIDLNREEPENSCRPAVDPLFRSIPAIFGNRCLGIIMTGMGSDGLKGCETLHSAGCPIIVQDKLSSVVWGMPKLVAMAGLAQQQVPLDSMAKTIMKLVGGPVSTSTRSATRSDSYTQSTILGRHS